jgi:prepilin-type N-terminal cleavage/methylation domain-containing protein
MKTLITKNTKAFTLIELLLVIGILAIIIGLVLAVINPQRQRQRAAEGVARGNLAKVCQAIVACQSSLTTFNSALCDSWAEVGTVGNAAPDKPTVAVWSAPTATGTATLATGAVYATVNVGGCLMSCTIFNDLADWGGQRSGSILIGVGAPGAGTNPTLPTAVGNTLANCATN